MGLGKINKQKGTDAELYFMDVFHNLGFRMCYPSRHTSKKHDNAGIDLMNLPFNIQVKAGRQKNLNPGKELFSMSNKIQSMFPKEDEVFKKPCLLFHINNEDEIKVYMSLIQFYLFKAKSRTLEYESIKEFKFEMKSEFRVFVGMSFEVFKNEIILNQYPNGSIRNTTE